MAMVLSLQGATGFHGQLYDGRLGAAIGCRPYSRCAFPPWLPEVRTAKEVCYLLDIQRLWPVVTGFGRAKGGVFRFGTGMQPVSGTGRGAFFCWRMLPGNKNGLGGLPGIAAIPRWAVRRVAWGGGSICATSKSGYAWWSPSCSPWLFPAPA